MDVRLGKAKIGVELAETLLEKARGLMFRRSLPADRGMLFVFDREAQHGIWMFGMRFPIDIIWVGKDKRVVDIVENATPCWFFCRVYMPKKKAKYVLEANAGFVERQRIDVGSKLVADKI